MKAEIMSIGSELASGRSLDTNSQWLSLELAKLGIPVWLHTTVADDMSANLEALHAASQRSDLVLLTGGLGPTQDDLTRQALAELAGVELVFHQACFEAIQQLFASRNRPMPERNRVQAMFPRGSDPIPNPYGSAPGIWMTFETREGRTVRFAAMPGVPSEMHSMFLEQVRPRIATTFGIRGVILHRKINTYGAGESQVEEKLMDLTLRGRNPEVGITASDATISLRISAAAEDEPRAQALIEPTAQIIYERLGDLIFSEGDVRLEDVVGQMLARGHKQLATAEGCTGGLVASRLSRVPGASRWFAGGVVAYNDTIKQTILGVARDLVEKHGVVSHEVVRAMAQGVRQRFRADLGLATAGLAGPEGGTQAKPVGTVFVALATPDGTESLRVTHFGDRATIQSRAAKHALNMARLWLRKL